VFWSIQSAKANSRGSALWIVSRVSREGGSNKNHSNSQHYIVAMFALTIGIATFDRAMPCSPGAAFRNGVYVNLTTGKPASLPAAQVATPPKAEGPSRMPSVSPSGGGGESGGGK
jgi:hypothetical protein